jgi:hypothetical protein
MLLDVFDVLVVIDSKPLVGEKERNASIESYAIDPHPICTFRGETVNREQ